MHLSRKKQKIIPILFPANKLLTGNNKEENEILRGCSDFRWFYDAYIGDGSEKTYGELRL